MACFIVPAAEGIVTTVVSKSVKNKETEALKCEHGEIVERIPFSVKLSWLNKMLFGGAALLAFEHVWHGEVVPFFPFLSAMNDPAQMSQMLHEMGTVGVAMAGVITLVWGGMVAVTNAMQDAALKKLKPVKEENRR